MTQNVFIKKNKEQSVKRDNDVFYLFLCVMRLIVCVLDQINITSRLTIQKVVSGY